MWEAFFNGPLALHPEYVEPYARRAISAGAGCAKPDTEVRAGSSGSPLLALDPPGWSATEGRRFPEPAVINGVYIMPLYGLLAPSLPWYERGTSTEQFAMQLLSAIDNPEIREIVIRVNSPGGLMSGTEELAKLIYDSRDRKPITAFACNGLMCSAGYAIGSAAGKVYATPSTEIGSIGVIWAHYDYTAAAEAMGVKVSLVSIPGDKSIGYPQRPLTEADRQKLIDSWLEPGYEQFVNGVARNRAVSADTVKERFGGGLTFLATEAANRGMIDGVRDWTEYLAGITQSTGSTFRSGGVPQTILAQEARAMQFSTRLKAIMLAAGIIEAMDAADAVCAMALRAWCAARKIEVPTDEAGAFAAVQRSMAEPNTPAAVAAGTAQQNPTAPPAAAPAQQAAATAPAQQAAPAAAPLDLDAEFNRRLAAENQRQATLRARATMLADQLGIEIPEATLNAALADTRMTAAAFSEQVLATAQQTNRPVGRIENGPAALDKFTHAAAASILIRSGPELARMAVSAGANQEQAQQQAAQAAANLPGAQTAGLDHGMVRACQRMSFLQIAQESVRLSGNRPTQNSDEGWAQAFLRMAGADRLQPFAIGHPGIEGGLMASAPIHGPGSFPNLMGLVAQSTSYFAINVAPVSYWRWATRHDDALNFNPQEILQFYGSTRLDEHIDTKPPGQATFAEQTAWIQVDQYSKGAKLSSRMIIQNQMATFMRMLVQFQIAIERTVNELVVGHLTGNTPCPFDGVEMFHTSHANDRSSGNPPSITENKAMRLLLAQQTIPGDSLEAGLTFDFALYGSDNMNEAELQYLPAYRVVPASQTDVNQFTGRVEPIYEPLLSAADPVWYAGSRSPLVVGIVYSFLAGSGPGGRRVTYFDEATQCQSFDYYVEAGSALVNYQPYARNAGTGAEE